MFNSSNPFAKLVEEQQHRRNEQQQQYSQPGTLAHPPKPPAPAPLSQDTHEDDAGRSYSKPAATPPPLPDRPRSPPQPPRPENASAAASSSSFEQRYEEEEPPPYEEVLDDRILEQGPRRPFTAAAAQPAQHSSPGSYNNSPATPMHTRPTGYPGHNSGGMHHSYSHPNSSSYSYRPSYSHYPNRTGAPPISGIIRSGRPPPNGAVVYQAGDPRIGGVFCYKCDGTGKRTDWLFGITETCYKCGGIGRRFH